MMMLQQPLSSDFERVDGPTDETDLSLRAYVSQIPADKLKTYNPAWTDEQVIDWDGNFRSDGCLMLVCCERDVGVAEFRRVVARFIEWNQAQAGSKK